MELTLRKALQKKNRLASDLNKLRSKLRDHNVKVTHVRVTEDGTETRIENERKVNITELSTELEATVSKLVSLKTEIAKANTAIYNKIYRMSEIKSEISFLECVPTRDGKDAGYGHDGNYVIHEAVLTEEHINSLVKALEEEMETLQDEVDHYNAVTKITVDL